ncbi:MAG: hypothetical protein HQ512_00325 [Rhodospirillales bacterium]|nr:hypothetical protein [Rhodospirillales bacterium]
MTLKVLAGDLTATFNPDGSHLNRYLRRKILLIKSLSDQLLLHDKILIPTPDFLTAAGLIIILGERNVITLLETDRLNFIRHKGVYGYIRGTGPDGSLLTFNDPKGQRPQDSPIEESVEAAIKVINEHCSERKKISTLLVERSEGLETSTIVDAIRLDAYADFKQTMAWKESYRFDKEDLLALPGMKKMGVRVFSPGHFKTDDPVDTLLALGHMNIELYLSEKFKCTSTSTASPIADCVSLKLPRLAQDHPGRPQLWSFLEVAGVPNISQLLLSDNDRITNFIELTDSPDAKQFRKWFHSNANLSEKEILQRYIDLLHQVPWTQRAPGKTLRLAITTAAGFLPVLGAVASVIDTFVVDKLLSEKSPKFFIENLRNFSGQIKLSE